MKTTKAAVNRRRQARFLEQYRRRLLDGPRGRLVRHQGDVEESACIAGELLTDDGVAVGLAEELTAEELTAEESPRPKGGSR